MKAPSARWSGGVIALHWLSAAWLALVFALGLAATRAELDAARKFDLYQTHKALGWLTLGASGGAPRRPRRARRPAAGAELVEGDPRRLASRPRRALRAAGGGSADRLAARLFGDRADPGQPVRPGDDPQHRAGRRRLL